MHHQMTLDRAMKAAEQAWDRETSLVFKDSAFEAAMRAYMHVLANPLTDRKMPAPKMDRPAERTVKEHFLAISSGHYEGYSMTKGRTGSIHRDVICFCPDPKSSILLPLFMNVHTHHDPITDLDGRRFDVELG